MEKIFPVWSLMLRTFCLSFTVLPLRRLADPLLQIANAIRFKTIGKPSWAMPERLRQKVRNMSWSSENMGNYFGRFVSIKRCRARKGASFHFLSQLVFQ